MKYIRIYLVVTVTVSGLLLMSCKKDDYIPKGLLESIDYFYNNLPTKYEYEYDSQNRLTKGIRYHYGAHPMTLNYNADGDLEKYEFTGSRPRDGRRATFSRKGNIITFIHGGMIPGIWTMNGEIELNAQGLPVKMISEYEELGFTGYEKNVSCTTLLTWQNGNIIKEEWEEESLFIRYNPENWAEVIETIEDTSAGTNTFTHDDKKPPFFHCQTPKWVVWWLNKRTPFIHGWYNTNNIKTETREDGSTKTYEYTYNNDGFPVTRTWVVDSTTFSVTYTYKGK